MKSNLESFLKQQCRERHLSLRGLSVAAGLSPGTLHNMLRRKYQPTLFSLNRLADYLGVQRPYIWHLAGLLPDMSFDDDSEFGARLRFELQRIESLPSPRRKLALDMVKTIIDNLESYKPA